MESEERKYFNILKRDNFGNNSKKIKRGYSRMISLRASVFPYKPQGDCFDNLPCTMLLTGGKNRPKI